MKKLRVIIVSLAVMIACMTFAPIEVHAGNCGGSPCGCSSSSCNSSMVCWYSSPWSYCVGHNFGNTWTYVSTSATCTSGGYDQWRGYCSICRQWYELYLPSGPLGHNFGGWNQYSSSQHVRYCSRCGLADYGNHRMGNWYDGGNGWHYRSCADCGYTERYDFTAPSILGFTATPTNWSAGNGTVSLRTQDKGSGVNYAQLYRTNVNSGATDLVATWHGGGSTGALSWSYTETSEGVFYYTVHIYDMYGNHSSSTSSTIYLDHSDPVISGIETTVTDWTNRAPVISTTATDFLAGTTYNGSGLSSMVVKDDNGVTVASGVTSVSYTLAYCYEGIHTWTVIATDNVGHTSSVSVTTKYDCTPPGMDGTEVTHVENGITYSGYCQDNIIDQHIDDEPGRSPNVPNATSGLEAVIVYKVKDGNREAIYSATTQCTWAAPDTHSYFNVYYDINETDDDVDYYLVVARDFAGNMITKKLTSQRTLLKMFHTSIDRTSYE